MTLRLVLASSSEIRAALLRNAGLDPEIRPARIDEDAIRAALDSDGRNPRDLAEALAELKARRVSERNPEALVLGCDQILDLDGGVFTKPDDPDAAKAQIRALSGRTHRLFSAVVVCRAGAPLWRHVGTARLTMREVSDGYLDDYVARNWESIRHSVGAYKIEEEGVRLFSHIEGDHFTILGLPLIELLTWLAVRGDIAA
ncbi:Maf family protein [Albidovulum sp.]|uniref:Maf family protein n=1 Tax=Albidovulum sp. TaxID=1872424 RepID=UPI0039B81F76